MRKFAIRLIWISATIGGVAILVFLIAASRANHANAFLPFAILSPYVVLLKLIGVFGGVVLLIISELKK